VPFAVGTCVAIFLLLSSLSCFVSRIFFANRKNPQISEGARDLEARAIESPPLKLLTVLIAWRYSPMCRAMRQEMR